MSRAKENAELASKIRAGIGGIVTSDADSLETVAVGTDGQVLTADSSEPNGIKWASPGASGLSAPQITDLTDGGESTLHYHASDRDLANATGSLSVSKGGTGATLAQTAINTLTAVSGATVGDVLTKSGTNAVWLAPSGAGIGDVSGPASSVDANLPSFSGTSGKTLQDSGIAAASVATKTGSETLTNKTISTGSAWNGTAVGPTYGGTGQSSYAKGDLVYSSATNILSKLPIGAIGSVLTVNGSGLPTWAATSTSVNVSAGYATYSGSHTGFTVGSAGPGIDGVMWWAGAHNWTHFQPTKFGAPCQVQVYTSCLAIVGTKQSPNRINAVYGTFNASELFVGDYVGFDDSLYVVASIISSTAITVTKAFVGGSPAWATSSTEKPFFKAYEIAEGTCNVSGTAVTKVTGDDFPYGYGGDHQYAFINGTKYNVTSGPEVVGTNRLTLSTSLGTLSGASIKYYRQYAPWSYVSLFRIQGIAGGKESNAVFSLNTRNELVIGPTATQYSLQGNLRIESPRTRIGGGEVYPYNGTTDWYGVEVIAPMDNLSFGAHYVSLGGYNGREAVRVITWNEYTDHLTIFGSVSGVNPGPQIKAEGSSANLDIVLTPKGSGVVWMGNRTSTTDQAITGFITVKDSTGTTRYLACIG